MLNKKEFMKLMLGLGEIYDKQITEIMADIYYESLKEFDTNQVKNAVSSVIRSHKYSSLPKPAEILEFLEGTKDDKALLAWIKTKEAVQKSGYYMTPEFDDPIISHCLIELGGWMKFCSVNIEDLPFIEKRFMDLYRLFLKRGITTPQQLIGFIDLKNIEKGYQKQQTQKLLK